MTCVKCKTATVPPENGAKAPLCRQCRAELILSGEEVRVGTLDRVYADNRDGFSGKITELTWEELQSLEPTAPFDCRRIRCSVCGASEPYDPMKSRQGWPCERCHRHGLGCCMAYVVHKDFGLSARAMCKFCRAELELSGQPCEEANKPLPGAAEAKP